MSDDTTDDDTISIDVPLDKHRAGMWTELTDEFGEDRAKELLQANLAAGANQIVTQLYDNRAQISGASQEFTTNPADAEDKDD